jgi:hypothetical protein
MEDGILWNTWVDDCLRILGFAYVRHASLFLTYGLRQRRVDIVAHVTFTSCTDHKLHRQTSLCVLRVQPHDTFQ